MLSGLTNPSAIEFASDGRVFVAEKSGLVRVFDSLDDPSASTFADLRTNVHNFWDRGLLGMALHPSFPMDPRVYVLYTHDAAIGGTAPRWGTVGGTSDGCPSPPGATSDGCVVSGRLSVLTASGNTSSGETVLVEDWCQQYPSHTVGDLRFGADGALYVSAGDGASFSFTDYGQDGSPVNPCGDPPGGVGGSMTVPSAQGGALRTQDLVSSGDPVTLDGTVLRLNPNTGAAMAGNPLIGSADTNARRIVAHGFRNPFRFTIRPGTSDLWVGDVGWEDWEEINRIADPTAPVSNRGWPCIEGALEHPGTYADLSLCQTVYDAGTAVAPTFAYRHEQAVAGESCPTGVGSSLSGLAFYNGGNYPAAFNGALFFADYSRKCIWVMYAGADGLPNPSTIEPFIENAFAPVQLKIGPGGDLFYPDFNGGTVHRVTYSSPAGTPVADVDASPTSGTAPLTVAFDGRGSTDPNGDSLTYAWDLDGDGSFDDSTSATPSFTYTIDGDVLVRLRVTDPGGLFGTATVLISVTLGGSVRYVSDLAFTLSANGWGPVERDRSNGGDGAGDGGPIMIGGTTYPKGLGVHAESEVRLDIPIGCTSFAAVVGIDDESGAIGSVTFTVLGGTEVLATSNLLTGADAGQALNVDVGTATELRLVVAGGADIVSDHADWADAQFSCSDGGNAPPTPVIGTPAASFTWHVDETVNFSGSATDAEDGAIPASGLSWTLVLQHCATTGCHAHTVQSWNGVASGSFAGPDHEYPAHLELRLTATDSDGASTMVTRTLQPETVDLTFATSPTGLQLTVGSATAAAPFTRTVIVGSTVGVGAPTPQTIGSAWYDFSTWSDGGARNHDLVAPGAATTYTAAFVAAVPPPAVTGLSAQPTTENTKLSWTAVAGVAGYHVYRASSASGPFSRVNGSALTTPTFTDTSAPPLTSSWYRVTAVAANGIESAPATTIGHRRIQLVGITSTTNNGLNQIQVAAPAGRQVNDLMLATLTIGGAQTITPPAGWTLVRVDTSGSALRQAIYSRFVTASEPSTATFALSSPAAGVGAVALYRGVSTSTPIEAHSGRVNPTSLQVATTPITTLTAHAAVVGAFGAAWHTAVTPPSSMLDQAGGSYQRWKQGASMRIADRVFTAPSSTGTLTATVRRAAVSIGQLVALRPAAP